MVHAMILKYQVVTHSKTLGEERAVQAEGTAWAKGRGEKQHGLWGQEGQTTEGHKCPIKELEFFL